MNIDEHPDLKDEAWVREANKRAQQEIRKQRRQARMRRHSGKVVSAIALVVIGATLFGFYQAGKFGELSLPEVNLPRTGVNVQTPFAGTPAEQWPSGEAGIVVPDANPAFEKVKQAIIASRMDPALISEHKPDRFLAMLAPEMSDHVAKEVRAWTTHLKPGTKLLPNGIRVSGKMTLGEKDGYPAVTTDYVFAYAFEPPDPKQLFDQMDIVAVTRKQMTYTVTPEGLWLSDADGFMYSIACKAAEDDYLAPSFTEPITTPSDAKSDGVVRTEKDYFSVDGKMPNENSC